MAAFSAAGVCVVNCVRELEEGWCSRVSLSESSSNCLVCMGNGVDPCNYYADNCS